MKHLAGDLLPTRLVVPLDGSDFALRALPFAAAWARCFDADVEVMSTPHTVERAAPSAMPQWLDEAAAALDAPRVRARIVDRDDPVGAITELVEEIPRTSLCMTTHGRGPLLGTAMGHVAELVVRRISTPTALIGPHCGCVREGPMVVCHDGSRPADAILAPAAAWAQALHVSVLLVHAIHSLDVESARCIPHAVRNAADQLGAPPPLVIRSSSPSSALLDAFTELQPSMVALTTHGRSGIARIALGSTATHLVQSCASPVFVVRPTLSDLREEA